MSHYQDSGPQPTPGTRGPLPGRREGSPAWSAAWTAAATSCAVSASMTMFRRSSTRRTTCPAYGSVPDGSMAPGEGPVAAGSVTTRTVKERSWPGCSTRRAWRQKLDPYYGGTGGSRTSVRRRYGQFCCQLQRETSVSQRTLSSNVRSDGDERWPLPLIASGPWNGPPPRPGRRSCRIFAQTSVSNPSQDRILHDYSLSGANYVLTGIP